MSNITYACFEAQAFQTYDLISAMEKDTSVTIETIRVDGGLANNNLMCQILSNTLSVSVERPKNTECTALGAAMLAGLGAGIYKDTDDLKAVWQSERVFEVESGLDDINRAKQMKAWKAAISAVQEFAKEKP